MTIVSKPASQEYLDNYELIFRKKPEPPEEAEEVIEPPKLEW